MRPTVGAISPQRRHAGKVRRSPLSTFATKDRSPLARDLGGRAALGELVELVDGGGSSSVILLGDGDFPRRYDCLVPHTSQL